MTNPNLPPQPPHQQHSIDHTAAQMNRAADLLNNGFSQLPGVDPVAPKWYDRDGGGSMQVMRSRHEQETTIAEGEIRSVQNHDMIRTRQVGRKATEFFMREGDVQRTFSAEVGFEPPKKLKPTPPTKMDKFRARAVPSVLKAPPKNPPKVKETTFKGTVSTRNPINGEFSKPIEGRVSNERMREVAAEALWAGRRALEAERKARGVKVTPVTPSKRAPLAEF